MAEIFRHIAINYGAESGGHLAAERPCIEGGKLTLNSFAHVALAGTYKVERLNLEFTFAIRGRNIETELPSKTLGTRNLTDTAMLIRTIDFHLATLQGI